MHSSPSSIQGSQIGVAAGGALYNIRRLIKARWRAVELSQQHERPEWVAIHLNNLGNCQRETGEDLDEAVMLQHESFALFSRLGSQWGAAMALCDLGWVTTDRGDLEGASEQLGLNDE